jgi:peptidoglycan/LPS O-acetylase OafA/YrhL
VNRKYLLHAIILFIAIGNITQYFWAKTEFDIILPFTCFDALGLGALLCWISLYKPNYLKGIYKGLIVVIAALFIPFIIKLTIGSPSDLPGIIFSLIPAFVISYVLFNEGRKEAYKFSFILENRLLIFLGKLCYGLYLYHNILPHYLSLVFNKIHLNSYLPQLLADYYDYFFFITNFLLLIFISWLSWKYIEQPIVGLKKYFEPRFNKDVRFEKRQSYAA